MRKLISGVAALVALGIAGAYWLSQTYPDLIFMAGLTGIQPEPSPRSSRRA